jgi:hypothetical protein
MLKALKTSSSSSKGVFKILSQRRSAATFASQSISSCPDFLDDDVSTRSNELEELRK